MRYNSMKSVFHETLKKLRNNIIVFVITNMALLGITLAYNPFAFLWIFAFIILWAAGLVLYYIETYKNLAVRTVRKRIIK